MFNKTSHIVCFQVLKMNLLVWLVVGYLHSCVSITQEYLPRHSVGLTFQRMPENLAINAEFLDLTLAIPFNLSAPSPSALNSSAVVELLDIFGKSPQRPFMLQIAADFESFNQDLYARSMKVYNDIMACLSSPVT